MVHRRRLPQRRSPQPAHHRPRQCLRPRRRRQSARLGRPEWRGAHRVCPAKAPTRTTPPASAAARSATARRPGATCRRTSGCAPPTARPPAVRSKTGPSTYDDLEPFYEKAEYEIGVSGDYSGTPFHGPRTPRSAHAAASAESRIRHPRAGGQTSRPASRSTCPWRATAFPTTAAAPACAAAGAADSPAKSTRRTARRIP